jgi:hypothetical protein
MAAATGSSGFSPGKRCAFVFVLAAAASSPPLLGGEARRALLISVDGLRADVVTPERMPFVSGLLESGASTLAARSQQPTMTIPNHVSMATGLTPGTHGYVQNFPAPGTFVDGTIFELAKAAGRTTGAYVTKTRLTLLTKAGTLDRTVIVDDDTTAVPAAALAMDLESEATRWDLAWIHVVEPDSVGHASGWMSPEYFAALSASDQIIEDLFAVLSDNNLLEETFVLVVSDHGGLGNGHGDNVPEVYLVPWIAVGPGVPPGHQIKRAVGTHDTGPTLLRALDIDVPGDMEGTPVEEVLGPSEPDADGDGLPDRVEEKNGLDPEDPSDAVADLDEDGLTNLEEHRAGTSLASADTDGDGVSDGDEVARGLDPLRADTDGDGLEDGVDLFPGFIAEVRIETPPAVLEGEPAAVRASLHAPGGAALTEPSVRFTVEASGGALFGDSAAAGSILSGAGTSAVFVESAGGVVELAVRGAEAATVLFTVLDTEGVGIGPGASDVLLVLAPAGDHDADGIGNSDEIQAGTDPTDRDTDGDGVDDGVETGTGIFIDVSDTGTDPLDPDTDGDGVTDGAELAAGSYPTDPESVPAGTPLRVQGLNPSAGPSPGGTLVQVIGAGFIAGDTRVMVGGVEAAQVNVPASTVAVVTMPPHATGPVVVQVFVGPRTAGLRDAFTYTPHLRTVSPSFGPAAGGTEVTLTGLGFLAGTTVRFGAAEAESVVVQSSRTLTVVTPAGQGVVDVSVMNADGTSVRFGGFRYLPPPSFVRGDVDADERLLVTDAIQTLNYLFLGAGEPPCLDAADIDDDGNLSITDPISFLNFAFLGGEPPPAPGPESCGIDPTPDRTLGGALDLGCLAFSRCE